MSTAQRTPEQEESAAAAWNEDAAEGWRQHGAILRRWLRDATARMLDAADIRPGYRVLDVAAGAGDQTRDIAGRLGPDGFICVTDVSAGILECARQELSGLGGPRLEFSKADAENLGLAGAEFDAAICRLGLMFCSDPLRALTSIRDALRRDGRLSGIVFSRPEANPCLGITMRIAGRHAGLTAPQADAPGSIFSLSHPGRLHGLLAQAGFNSIDVEPIAAPFSMESCASYVEFLRTSASPLIAMLAPLSPAQRAAAWSEIASELDRFSTSTGWEGPNELLLFSVKKG